MGSTLNGQPRFGRDMAGPAKTFSYLTDGLIFLILFRIGLTINTPQPGSKNRRSRVIMILPETVLFMLLVLGLAYIGYVCDSVSLNLRNIYNFGHRDTALRIDIACSILVLGLACSVFTYAVATALKRHHGFSVQKVGCRTPCAFRSQLNPGSSHLVKFYACNAPPYGLSALFFTPYLSASATDNHGWTF